MRFVTVLSVLILLGVCVGAALADKYEPNEKPWSYGPMNPRADYPENPPDPLNDTCPGPQQLQPGDRIVCGTFVATTDDDFYQIYLTAGQLVSIGTDDCNGQNPNLDTYLELYDPTCGTRVAYDDDGGPGLFSLIVDYNPPTTGWYNIKTYTYAHSYTGTYVLFTVGAGQGEPNDTCNPDYSIACGTGVLNGDMTTDHNDYDPLSGGCATGYPEAGKDVAYKMDLPSGAVIDMTYYTPNWDASFYIVTDCSNVPGTCVIGADAAGDTEVIHYVVPTAGTYWLILDHYGTNTGGGPWSLNYTINCETEPTGACCIDGRCTITTEANCGGQWLGPDYPTCDPNPCPTPTQESSWGQIKNTYR